MVACSGPTESTAPEEPRPGQPNIVLILTDDQRWDTLWAMPEVQMLLVGKGVTFSNAFAVNPLCCPSRASILTGQYSHTTGVYTNKPPFGGFPAFEDSSTVATWLQAAGYRTALVGKYLNGYQSAESSYVPPGWDRWFAFSGKSGGAYFDYPVSVDGVETTFTGPEKYSTDVLASEATAFIRDTPAEQPVFLYFAPVAPHEPAMPAPRHAQAFSDLQLWRPPSYDEADVSDKPAYIEALPELAPEQETDIDRLRSDQYRSLLAVDEAVGDLVATLEETGRLSDTLIVFASDNGFAWGEHRWAGKRVPYEESIRIPLVIRYDFMVPTARTDGRLALNIDLAPTLAAAAGVAAPQVDGRSLIPALSSAAGPWRESFLIENDIQPGPAEEVPTYCAVRTKRYVYVDYLASEDEELYDLTRDRGQLANAVDDPKYAAALGSLRNRLQRLCVPAPP